MSAQMLSYLFVGLCVLALAAGQLMFKAVSNRLTDLSAILDDHVSLALFAGALSLYGLSTILWVLALRQLQLSAAYPFMAIGFILVPLAAHYVFGEALGAKQLVGMGLIVIGIILSAT